MRFTVFSLSKPLQPLFKLQASDTQHLHAQQRLALNERIQTTISDIPRDERDDLMRELQLHIDDLSDEGLDEPALGGLLRAFMRASCQPSTSPPTNPEPSSDGDDSSTATGALSKRSYSLYEGAGAAPTAFVRSPLFACEKEGEQVFRVLGIKNVNVERGQHPMEETHLLTLAFLISRVQLYDDKLGATVVFNPWDAVRTLQWTRSTTSVARLRRAIDVLAKNTVRIIENDDDQVEKAPLVARRVTSTRKDWEVQLTATVLKACERFRTFFTFSTLHKLPRGAATRLYLFGAAPVEVAWQCCGRFGR